MQFQTLSIKTNDELRILLSEFEHLQAIGNTDLLQDEKLGVLCSRKCPGSVILNFFDLIAEWK